MIKRRFNSSILDMLMKNDREPSYNIVDKDEEEKSEDICRYFLYGYCTFNLSSENTNKISKNNYLLVINDKHTINFHSVNHYFKEGSENEVVEYRPESADIENEKNGDTCVVVEDDFIDLKKNALNLRTIVINKRATRKILRKDLLLILETPIHVKSNRFNFCACLELDDKLTLFYYDATELEYLEDNDTITLDHIIFRDNFPNVKSIYHDVPLTSFSDVYNLLYSALKRYKCKLKGFDEVEILFESALNNYKCINSITNHLNYDGLCINKCYLDENIVRSFSSFSYLDDSIIDFFNQLTYEYIMDKNQKDTWAILSTFFMRKIKQYKDSKEAYDNTWKWTRKLKRPLPLNHFIFIPINLSEVHWSLVIIAYPKYAIRYQNVKSEKKASIIHLDSLGHHNLNKETFEVLKNYLYQEFDNRCKGLKEKGFKFILDDSCWDFINPTKGIPLQNNGYDCGIYLIEYIIYLVLNQNVFSTIIPKYYEAVNNNGGSQRHSKWFTQGQIQQRRVNMKQVLKFMMDNPNWSVDESQINYIKDKMTKQY